MQSTRTGPLELGRVPSVRATTGHRIVALRDPASMTVRYRITVSGTDSTIVRRAVEELCPFELVATSKDRSTIVATVRDQSALHGVLHQLQVLRVDLLEVVRVDSPR